MDGLLELDTGYKDGHPLKPKNRGKLQTQNLHGLKI